MDSSRGSIAISNATIILKTILCRLQSFDASVDALLTMGPSTALSDASKLLEPPPGFPHSITGISF